MRKIRKWAEEKGYKVEGCHGYGGRLCIRVFIDNYQNGFEIEQRESSLYRSVKGMRGSAKGLYLSTIRNGRKGYGFWKQSQKDIIEEMEYEMKNF